ncbi:MAG: hypothetical protein R3200_08550 [Xanthomonadales bacterium]|nr:hypothetical protein [Xanthomonadales bacterium]
MIEPDEEAGQPILQLQPGDIPRSDDVWPEEGRASRQDGRTLLLMLLFINVLLLGFIGLSGIRDLHSALRLGIEVFEVAAVLTAVKVVLFPT